MKNFFRKYLWLWEMIGAALIIAMGILIAIKDVVLMTIVGIVFIVLGVLRIVPLVKTTDEKLLKWFYSIEIVIEILAGGVLVFLGFTSSDASFVSTIKDNFGYIIGGVFYLRGFIHFFAESVCKEDHPKVYFYVNMFILTIGAIIIGAGGFKLVYMKWVIFAIAILSALFVAYSGYKGYSNYRNLYSAERTTRKVKQTKQDNVMDVPTSEEIIPNENVNVDINEVPQEKSQDEVSL